MAGDDTGERGPPSGAQQQFKAQAMVPDASNDAAALDAVLGLGVRVTRKRIETCATLTGNAKAALGSPQAALAIDAILDVEPLLFEAQSILNAKTMLRRIVREAETAKD